jgi:hypothetical protein
VDPQRRPWRRLHEPPADFQSSDQHDQEGGRPMFEFDQDIVSTLLNEDGNFRRLYDKHHALKERVSTVNHGGENLDEFSLENLKKQKLMLKDQMADIIDQYRRTHSSMHH